MHCLVHPSPTLIMTRSRAHDYASRARRWRLSSEASTRTIFHSQSLNTIMANPLSSDVGEISHDLELRIWEELNADEIPNLLDTPETLHDSDDEM